MNKVGSNLNVEFYDEDAKKFGVDWILLKGRKNINHLSLFNSIKNILVLKKFKNYNKIMR